MSKPTNDFWSEFSTALSTKAEKRPTGKGWLPLEEWVATSRLSFSVAKDKLSRGFKAGLLDKFEGTRLQDGRLVRAVWYRRKGA